MYSFPHFTMETHAINFTSRKRWQVWGFFHLVLGGLLFYFFHSRYGCHMCMYLGMQKNACLQLGNFIISQAQVGPRIKKCSRKWHSFYSKQNFAFLLYCLLLEAYYSFSPVLSHFTLCPSILIKKSVNKKISLLIQDS